MYQLIHLLLDHSWVSGTGAPGDQQITYYIAGACIIILLVTIIDLFYRFVRSILNRGKFD